MSKEVNFADNHIKTSEDEVSEPELENNKRQFNKFELLDLVETESDVASANESDSSSNPPKGKESDSDDCDQTERPGSRNKTSRDNKRKTRKRRGKGKSSKKASHDNDLDDELTKLAITISSKDSPADLNQESSKYRLLKVDMRNLIPEAELKRIFGRGVVKDDRMKPKLHSGSNLQRSRFVASSYFDAKQFSSKPGPRMEIDEIVSKSRENEIGRFKSSDSDKSAPIFTDPDQPVYFNFVHDGAYQDAQQLFLEAVHLGRSDLIVQNLSVNQSHVESLVQLSRMVHSSENFKEASTLIENALLVFERGFHPRFNIAAATCRLSYKRPENRTFFITLFMHINYCHRRGLRRTPFEYSKLLLSLEPDNDPLMAVQLIDFYAIRSEEFDYLIEFFDKWYLSQKLPNLRFSRALAYFLKSRCTKESKSENETNLQTSDRLLKEALMLFPNFIIPLLDSCSAEPDAALKQCNFFDYSVYSKKYKLVPETVDVLVNLYVKRTFSLWKQKHVLTWLERNVAEMVSGFADGSLADTNEHIRHWTAFPKVTPKNLLRHIVLCDLDLKVPASASSASFIDIDPFPPTDYPIISYDTTPIRNRLAESNGPAGSRSTLLDAFPGLFLRSILPSFSLTTPSQTGNPPGQSTNPTLNDTHTSRSSNSGGNQAGSSQRTSREVLELLNSLPPDMVEVVAQRMESAARSGGYISIEHTIDAILTEAEVGPESQNSVDGNGRRQDGSQRGRSNGGQLRRRQPR